MNTGPEEQSVLIVGMGPGGLAAAIVAAQRGLQVTIVENRNYFTRGQRVHADKSTVDFLVSLKDSEDPLDSKFFEQDCFRSKVNQKDSKSTELSSDAVVQVKDVQAFLARKLEKYKDTNVTIMQGKGFGVKSIDPTSNTVKFTIPSTQKSKYKKEMQFNHIIAADGARHGVTELLNQSKDPVYHIEHKKLITQARQEDVGAVALQLKSDAPIIKTPIESSGTHFTHEHLKRLGELGWDQPYFPKVRVFISRQLDENNTDDDPRLYKYFFSGEIPKIIQHMDKKAQRQALEEWGKFIVSVEMGISPDDLELPTKAKKPIPDKGGNIKPEDQRKYERSVEKDNLRATAFKLQLSRADKPAVELANHGAFVLVGDAYKNANFFYGHGMNDAIQDGILAAKSIDATKPGFNFTDYNKHQERNVRLFDSRMSLESSAVDLPQIVAEFNTHVSDLMRLAKRCNDPEIQKMVNELISLAQPGGSEFDVRYYALTLEDIIKKMNEHIEDKMSENSNKKRKSLTFDKNEKLVAMQNDLKKLSSNLNKDISRFYRTNIDPRQNWHDQLSKEPAHPVKKK